MRYLPFLIISVYSMGAPADLESDMNNFFDGVNLTNVTRPGVYEGQSAGYYTGGSLFVRVPQRNYSLLDVQWPRARAGCGGIDLFAGGFTFINSDELIAMLRNVGSAAVSYAFMLALRTITPQIASTIEQLQEWAQRFNLGNINSCEQARNIIGAGMKQLGVQNAACVMERIETQGESWAEARIACGTGGRRSESLNRAGNRADLDNVLLEGNMAWRALMRNDFFRADLRLAELVMNLSGSLIIGRVDPNSDDSQLQYRFVPSLLQDQRGEILLRLLLEGSAVDEVEIFACGAPVAGLTAESQRACTTLTTRDVRIAPGRSLRGRVEEMLRSISDKIRADTMLNTSEQALLENVTLPVHKYLTVRAAFLFSSNDFDLGRYATLIAKDLALKYLVDLIGKLAASAATMGVRDDDKIIAFQQQLRDARNRLAGLGGDLHRQFNEALDLTRDTRFYEQALATRMVPVLQRGPYWSAAGNR